MTVQMLTISGKRFALVPMREFEALQKRAAARELPSLPDPFPNGNYPAAETVRVLYARRLIQERESVGLSQSELARRAGLRPETINRLEKGKHSPDTATVTKISKALRAAGVDV
ncbi:MAG TPA: helix-turn-helix transcriptional regulator [Tepidisphaeraceae bacterium]|jgi:DNA-binding XRE family transcriptional regulator|nr:helix-turn-helix transcriptional regulator [Tepidisphaeraceae bacterium]